MRYLRSRSTAGMIETPKRSPRNVMMKISRAAQRNHSRTSNPKKEAQNRRGELHTAEGDVLVAAMTAF
jgi:hypothetical protein